MHCDEITPIPGTAAVDRKLSVALLGNPNSGKSSIFNQLTGLRQKVGNFPGVTVDKKTGYIPVDSHTTIKITDFPGTYSFYPHSEDERIVVRTFSHPGDENYPDAVVYVADVTKLEKHLLLFSQLMDMGLPVVLALNMSDIARKEGLEIDSERLRTQLGVPVLAISGRTGDGIPALKSLLSSWAHSLPVARTSFYQPSPQENQLIKQIRQLFPALNDYQALLTSHHYQWLPHLKAMEQEAVEEIVREHHFQSVRSQVEETMLRYDRFTPIVRQAIRQGSAKRNSITQKLDALVTHSIAGPIIFFGLMLLVFQAIYAWAAVPMDWIESGFNALSIGIKTILPEGWWTDLLTDGLLTGLGGIMVFIPQIAILFFLISLLEEVGYMARAVFLFDRIMQVFGLNGRSVVALISGGACAIPAIMSTRTIGHWRERLITILVTPLISCSARIPVYTVLIGFVVPPGKVAGIFNLQGIAFMGLYLLGIAGALFAALVFKWILKTREHSFLLLELPEYRLPVMRNIGMTVWEKVKTFAIEAGQVILVIALLLWALASFGPPGQMAAAEAAALKTATDQQFNEHQTKGLVASERLEASFAGSLGKWIEPAIRPLGFDWKIGIALITSFAAREVFVGTMATIYSLGDVDDELSVRQRMAQERNPVTGELVYTRATSLSLLLFYVFAMMCMSTLAVVKRETKSWKWPIVQFTFMTVMAYLSSFIVYQLLK